MEEKRNYEGKYGLHETRLPTDESNEAKARVRKYNSMSAAVTKLKWDSYGGALAWDVCTHMLKMISSDGAGYFGAAITY